MQMFSKEGVHMEDDSEIQVTVPLCACPILQVAGTEQGR